MNAESKNEVLTLLRNEEWGTARIVLDRCQDSERDVEWLAFSAESDSGLGHLDSAVSLYGRVLEERPRHPAALYNRALVLSELERHDDAVADLEDLVEVEGGDFAVLEMLADEYLAAEFLVPAWLCAERLESMAEDDSDRWSARILVARALDMMGRTDEAVDRLQNALGLWKAAAPERAEAQELLLTFQEEK